MKEVRASLRAELKAALCTLRCARRNFLHADPGDMQRLAAEHAAAHADASRLVREFLAHLYGREAP
jgi:hypothetical protein